jgi:hypothetical protein
MKIRLPHRLANLLQFSLITKYSECKPPQILGAFAESVTPDWLLLIAPFCKTKEIINLIESHCLAPCRRVQFRIDDFHYAKTGYDLRKEH